METIKKISLAACALIAFLLIFAEAEDLTVLIVSKAAGFALAWVAYRIAQSLDRTGCFSRLRSLLDE